MNSPFGLGSYLCWWNQQNRIYEQSFIILLTGIIPECPYSSKPFWSQSTDIFLLLLKNVFCDTAAIQKEAFQLQMEENSSRYGSNIWNWLGSILYPVKGMQEGKRRLEIKRRTWSFPMYNQESSLGEISSQKPQRKVSAVETMHLHTMFTAMAQHHSVLLPICQSAGRLKPSTLLAGFKGLF